MSLILSLDTSTTVCSLALHSEGVVIGSQTYNLQKSHSSILPAAIDELLVNCELEKNQLSAIAISAGPGSYTGLRIGTATAKGLCYALDLPLIAIDSLDTMLAQVAPSVSNEDALLCPMIDARRMEVYCKLYRKSEDIIWETKPLVIDEDTFSDFEHDVKYFFGNGSDKLTGIFQGETFRFIPDVNPSAAHMGASAFEKFQSEDFEDVAYFEPDYLKEFQTKAPSKKFIL